jgi:hypothetical protein
MNLMVACGPNGSEARAGRGDRKAARLLNYVADRGFRIRIFARIEWDMKTTLAQDCRL